MEGEAWNVIDTFVQMTQRMIGDGAIADYLPTLVNFETRTVSVLESVPEDIDIKSAVRDWLAKHDLETYCIAFRSGEAIHIMAAKGSHREFATLSRRDGVWRTSPAAGLL